MASVWPGSSSCFVLVCSHLLLMVCSWSSLKLLFFIRHLFFKSLHFHVRKREKVPALILDSLGIFLSCMRVRISHITLCQFPCCLLLPDLKGTNLSPFSKCFRYRSHSVLQWEPHRHSNVSSLFGIFLRTEAMSAQFLVLSPYLNVQTSRDKHSSNNNITVSSFHLK